MSKQPQKQKLKKSVAREWVESFIIAALVATVVRSFLFQMYRIPTESMVPVLKPGDKLLVNRLTYGTRLPLVNIHLSGFSQLQRGDIVVFVPPHEAVKPWYARKQFIKRLVGMSGERLMIKQGDVFINGERVTDARLEKNDYIGNPHFGKYGTEGNEITIPEGKYFFLGDNSAHSSDSRYWGFVDQEWILGKALFIWWPPKRIKGLE